MYDDVDDDDDGDDGGVRVSVCAIASRDARCDVDDDAVYARSHYYYYYHHYYYVCCVKVNKQMERFFIFAWLEVDHRRVYSRDRRRFWCACLPLCACV